MSDKVALFMRRYGNTAICFGKDLVTIFPKSSEGPKSYPIPPGAIPRLLGVVLVRGKP